jgi:hypothetical protein
MTQKQVLVVIEAKLNCKAIFTDSDTYMIDATPKDGDTEDFILFDIGYEKSSYVIRDKQGYFDNKDVKQILELI